MKPLAADIMHAVESNNLSLPTLPEVALRIRQCEHDPNLDILTLTRVIEHDPATTAQILRIANSPLVRREVKVADLSKAIGLLGMNYCARVAISLSTRQLFNSKKPSSEEKMREIWQHSLDVACHCYVLASKAKLVPEEAFLAGLLHKIGTLPIIAIADKKDCYSLIELNKTIDEIHPMLGENILNHWQFPRSIADIPQNYLDHSRYINKIDLCDLVTLANNKIISDEQRLPWNDIVAVERMGWNSDTVEDEFYHLTAEIELAHHVFEC
ncbi:MAG: HDOD domain-containing protein [Oleispira sp.]|nr:HDOD domain-containing protein [Oleispira sp.]